MTDDPAGYYAALEVDRTATREAIVAAFRRKARLLHPDVPGTGDASAFIRVQQAYEVLHDAERRAAYDRSAREAPTSPPLAAPTQHRPRMAGAVWASLSGLLCLVLVIGFLQLSDQGPSLPSLPPPRAPIAPKPAPPPVMAAPTGSSTHFVRPTGDDARLWQYDPTRDTYLPAGQVAAFTPVWLVRLVPEHGLAQIALADGSSGFVDAARLIPGDRAAAHRAYCAFDAGASPANGELLALRATGPARLEVSDRGTLPAVVKLRNRAGETVAAVYVLPGRSATLDNLPDDEYRPEFAVGELWSRACKGFAAGMRAQRFASFASPAQLSPLVIPPGLSAAAPPVDISDEVFERE